MLPDDDIEPPKSGQVWRYYSGQALPHQEFHVYQVTDAYVFMVQEGSDESVPPYELETFMHGIRDGNWVVQEWSAYMCSRCHQRTKTEDDYLCEECRYG